MNKEPIGLYIFRFLMGLGLFAFMAMLYWSSLLLEKDMKKLQESVDELKTELTAMRTMPLPPSPAENTTAQGLALHARSHIDAALPNLLHDDPFYITVLPKLLGPNFKRQGTFQSATIGKPNNLHPFSNWAEVNSWISQCIATPAKLQFGIYEQFTPDMALKIEERKNNETGDVEFWVHLRDGVFWQPLKPDFFTEDLHLAPQFLQKNLVTAHDFKFYFDAMMNPYVQEGGAVALRNYFSDIEEIRVIDNLTFVVRWKSTPFTEPNGKVVRKTKYDTKMLTGAIRCLPCFVYQYFPDGKKIIEDDSDPNTYRTNSVWAQNFAQHWAKNIIVSCGPWVFDGMTERQIRFIRNPDYYFPHAVLVESSEVQFKDSPDNIWQDFKGNKLDFYNLRPEQHLELETFLQSPQYQEQKKAGAEIKRLDYLQRAFAYIGWNQANPLFKSKKVRQALTMAIDRQRIIKQNLNGMGIEITCPFFRNSDAYDPSIQPWPYSPQQARRLLEEEGWFDRNGDGVIDKVIDGKAIDFRFKLTYYVKATTYKLIAEYIATALKEIGIICELNGVDVADLSALFDQKSFDAILMAWALSTPPENPKQLWYSAGKNETGSSNAIGFSNPQVDTIIDELEYEADPTKRKALYHRFDAILHDEAPYTFMYTPKVTMLYRAYLQNVFIPAERQDLIPGANVAEPDNTVFWLTTF